ncbi:MFS general substrate transporter [Atractiella rhizophila]|nr:MFS general substrate transporter [Atractiella rhizophila]
MASAFLIEVVTWGFAFSYGTFQSYYTSHAPFDNTSGSLVSAVGTVSIALLFSLMPLATYIVQRWPKWAQEMRWVSMVVAWAAIFGSSFCNQIWQLLLLQGIVFGFAAGLIYAPLIPYLSEWFITRRNLAIGIMFAGTGTGGTVLPLFLGALLDSVGFGWTLRIWSFVFLALTSIGLLFSSRRLPRGSKFSTTIAVPPTASIISKEQIKKSQWRFLWNPKFQILNTISILWALGFFPVPIYLPIYTETLGYPLIVGTGVLAVYNCCQAISFIIFGWIGDRYSYIRVGPVSFGLASLFAFFIWGFLADNLGWTFAFAFLYPTVIGGNASMWPAMAADVSKSVSGLSHASDDVPLIVSTIGAMRGIAAIIGPIIASELYKRKNEKSDFGAFGFKASIIFAGVCMGAASVLSVVMWMQKFWTTSTWLQRFRKASSFHASSFGLDGLFASSA